MKITVDVDNNWHVTMTADELDILRYALSFGVEKLETAAIFHTTNGTQEAKNSTDTAAKARAVANALEAAVQEYISRPLTPGKDQPAQPEQEQRTRLGKPLVEESAYCDHCNNYTPHHVYDSGHERDSSHDYWQCLRCGWEKHGLGGCYHKPNSSDWENYRKDYTGPLAEGKS